MEAVTFVLPALTGVELPLVGFGSTVATLLAKLTPAPKLRLWLEVPFANVMLTAKSIGTPTGTEPG
jgi:hypothetical protein